TVPIQKDRPDVSEPSGGRCGGPSMSRECLSVEERLERGEVIYYPTCTFAYPQGDDRDFLNSQRLAHRGHKNVSYDPHKDQAKGGAWDAADGERVRRLLGDFSSNATAWLAKTLPL